MVARPQNLAGEKIQRAAIQGKALAVDDVAFRVHDAGFDHALVDVQTDMTYNRDTHGRFSRGLGKTEGDARASGRWRKFGPRVRFHFRRQGRTASTSSSSKLNRVGRKGVRYDGGLEAHSHNRAAPKCPGPPVLPCCVVVLELESWFPPGNTSSQTRYSP